MKLSQDEQLRAIFLRNLAVGTAVYVEGQGNGYIVRLTADHVHVRLDEISLTVSVHYKEVSWPI
jgi:hypothetical protein